MFYYVTLHVIHWWPYCPQLSTAVHSWPCSPLMTSSPTVVHSSPPLTLQSTAVFISPWQLTGSYEHAALTGTCWDLEEITITRIHSIYKELKSFKTNHFKIMNGYLYWFNFIHEPYQICISTYTNQYMMEIDMDQRILVYIYNFTNFVNSWTSISLPSDDWPSCCSCSGSETTIRNQPGCWHLSARPGSTYTPDRRNSSNKAKWQVLSWLRNNNYNILILMT